MLSSLPETIHCKDFRVNFLLLLVMTQTYFSTGDREVGKDAVTLVLVSGVSFQAFSFRVVPQLEGVVEGCSKNVLSVWRELHKGNGRIVVVNESLETLSTGCVPYSAESVVARRDDERSIAVKVNSGDRIRMCWKCLQTFSRSNVPDPHGLIEAPRNDEIALRIEVAAEDIIAVTFESL